MKLRRQKQNKDESIGARLSTKDKNAILRKAMLYEVDLSDWIVYAALNFIPAKEDLEETPKKKRKKGRR